MKIPSQALVALWLALAATSLHVNLRHTALEPARPVVRWEDALLDLMGEGRTVLARLFWFTMDTMHEQLNDQSAAWSREGQVVPLLRMITFLDPHLWDAYDVLAYDLAHGYRQRSKALALVDEGLLFNPDNFALNYRRGTLTSEGGSWGRAIPFFVRALKTAGNEMETLSALRSLVHCAEATQDSELGLRALSAFDQVNPGSHLYDRQRSRWTEDQRSF